jgi:hypothetical protein
MRVQWAYTPSRRRIFVRNSGPSFPITTSIGTNLPSLAQKVSYTFNIMSKDSPRIASDEESADDSGHE